MTIEPKFKVGDIVVIKGSVTKLFIEEIITVTCTAGTQIMCKGFIGMDGDVWEAVGIVQVLNALPTEKVSLNEVLLDTYVPDKKCEPST